jgi:hypothetical protein
VTHEKRKSNLNEPSKNGGKGMEKMAVNLSLISHHPASLITDPNTQTVFFFDEGGNTLSLRQRILLLLKTTTTTTNNPHPLYRNNCETPAAKNNNNEGMREKIFFTSPPFLVFPEIRFVSRSLHPLHHHHRHPHIIAIAHPLSLCLHRLRDKRMKADGNEHPLCTICFFSLILIFPIRIRTIISSSAQFNF